MTHQQQTAFENIVGKGEIARNEQFLLFPQRFLLNQIIVSPFVHIADIISLFAGELEEPKTDISGRVNVLIVTFGSEVQAVYLFTRSPGLILADYVIFFTNPLPSHCLLVTKL